MQCASSLGSVLDGGLPFCKFCVGLPLAAELGELKVNIFEGPFICCSFVLDPVCELSGQYGQEHEVQVFGWHVAAILYPMEMPFVDMG